MARIRIGEHQSNVLGLLKQHGSWNSTNPTFDYQGSWQTNRLLGSLVSRRLATQDSDGTYRASSDGPPYIVSKTPAPRKNGRNTKQRSVVTPNPEARTTVKKLNPTELAAAMPTELLKNELLRRGYTIERTSMLDELVEWGR